MPREKLEGELVSIISCFPHYFNPSSIFYEWGRDFFMKGGDLKVDFIFDQKKSKTKKTEIA
jgi:hypothetical protein